MPTLTELKLLVDWSQDDYQASRRSNETPDEECYYIADEAIEQFCTIANMEYQ